MPIFTKCYSGADLVLGQITVGCGANVPKTYDPTTCVNPVTDRAQHWASGDAFGWAVNLNNRFLHTASGEWE